MAPSTIVDGKIANWKQLLAIVDNRAGIYTLTNNIVMPNVSDGCEDYPSTGWQLQIKNFSGTLDGAGHTISNLFINSTNADIGLIDRADTGAIIKNLVVDHIGITSTEGRIAAVVGRMVSKGTIENVRVVSSSGAPITGNYNVGSIVGQMNGGIVRASSSSSVVLGYQEATISGRAGGLVGVAVGG